ncbi:prolyl oligopeptidase family serine peptidase [Pseudoalteromonas xiamenensis]|uniref:alpha/beta hydrolase family protein n=1 Tax=Pseudoalteromonas xiamenensis TaxID=882626 RepID=UPI0035E4E016
MLKKWLMCLLVSFCVIAPMASQATDTEYQMPSPAIASVVDAKLLPTNVLSPDGAWMALLDRSRVLSLKDLAKPEVGLAGIRFNPDTRIKTTTRLYDTLEFKHVQTGSIIPLNQLPEGKIAFPSWSSNSQYLAFVVAGDKVSTLWLYDVKTRKLQQLSELALNAFITEPYEWLQDSSAIVAAVASNHSKTPPEAEKAKLKPVIQESKGEKAPVRTYQNLLQTPHDEALFKFYGQTQLVKLTLDGRVQGIGPALIISDYAVSPDATNLLIAMIDEPFSYQVPYKRFPTVWQIWGMRGHPLYELARVPLAETIPQGFDSVQAGRREFQWRADKGATVIWAEAQDGGSMKAQVPFHDYLYSISAPFRREPELFAKMEWRFSHIDWADDNVALLSEWRFQDRHVRTHVISPRNADENRVLFSERSYNDSYKDPGSFVMTYNDLGSKVVKLVGGRYMYLVADGASAQGKQPYLARYDIKTNDVNKVWQSEAPYYERVVSVLDDEGMQFITLRESATEQPNYFLRNLADSSITQLTRYDHPYPDFIGVTKEVIKYTREDGTQLSGTLYLPAGYTKEKGPLPVLMWAYPLEFKDKAVASQMRESPYEFNYIGFWGPMPYLSKGIAVFDDPKMPIVGEGDSQPNDSFIPQLVSSAKAAVDTLVERGIADKNRIAIAGHSYGAFMVANLLAHSDLFKTGIARSGAYNRSLTPFGFQGEERDFWQAQTIYSQMSPFFNADKIDEPLLLIHGKEDPNSGTFPMQSERMYAALNGLGKTARLVMLPEEGHGYKARESIMHVLWEQERWLDKYLMPEGVNNDQPTKAVMEIPVIQNEE